MTNENWNQILSLCDDTTASYLTRIKGSKGTMTGYSVSLQGNVSGLMGVTKIMRQYNALGETSTTKQRELAGAIALNNTQLGSYLIRLNGAKASLVGYGTSLVGSTIKTVALTVATAALNAALTMGMSFILTGLVSAFSAWINSSEKITEAAEEAKDKINSINNDLKTNTQTVEKAKQRYAELAQEVNNLGKSNQNRGSLSTDEYEEFLDLSNQLAEAFPQLTKGYDDNGNAILNLSGNVDTIVNSLDDLLKKEKELANQKIMEEFPNVYKGYNKNISKAENAAKDAQTKFDRINDLYQQISQGGAKRAFDLQGISNFTNQNGEEVKIDIETYKEMLKDAGIKYKTSSIKAPRIVSTSDAYNYQNWTTQGTIVEAEGDVDVSLKSALDSARKDFQYAEQKLKNEKSSIVSYLNTWLQSEFSYTSIENKGLQSAVQNMVTNFDFSKLPENIDKNNWEEVSEYLRRNILFAINNIQNDSQISKAFSEVFSNQDLMPKEKYNYIQQIIDYFGEDNVITLSLQPEIDDVNSLKEKYDNVINRFKDSEDTKLDELKQSYQEAINKRKELYSGTDLVGNVDINNRPVIINDDGSYSTTSTTFQEKWVGDEKNGHYIIAHFTPYLPDGTELSEETLNEYIDRILSSDNPMEADKTENGGYGIVYQIDTKVNGKKITDANLKDAFEAADAWDVNMHNRQDKIYKAEAEIKSQVEEFEKQLGTSGSERTKIENFFKDNSINTLEELEYWKTTTAEAKNATEAIDMYNEAKRQAMTFDVDSLTKKIDEIQNVYKTLKDAIKEYNKEGYISVDTFQSIIGLGAEYLKYLVDEDGNLKLNAQSLQELTIARVKDMIVAQKNKILDTADSWSTEADAAQYLKANLDETSDSYDDIIEKKLQLLRIKWTSQLDENGNRVWTDEQIESTIAGLRKQFGSLDTVQNAAIKGIKSGFGMTGESAKDNTDKIKDINKQLDDLAKSEALQKLKYKFDQLEQGITKIDTALSLLNNISDLTYEDDYIGKIEIVSNQLDLATSKAQLLQNKFEQLSAEQYDTADSSNELASRMKSTADSIAENQKQIIEYGKNITSYYMSALSAINSLSKNSIERATTLIDRNIKTLSEGGLTGLEFSFVPTVPQSAIEKQRNENQSLKNEMQSYYNSVAEMQKTALDLQYKEQMVENEKKRQEILKSLKEQQNDLNKHYATVAKAQEIHNATTQENQKQSDAAIIAEQQNAQTNSLNEISGFIDQFKTMIKDLIDWLAQNPLSPTINLTNLDDVMNSTNSNTLNGMAYYNQKDYNDLFAGGTIATSGCGVTSAAMVATTLTGKTVTPSEVAKLAKEKGYEVSAGTSWGLFNNLGSIYNFHGEEIGKDDNSILAALNSGKKVIVSEGKGTWTSGAGHIIVLAGASDGKIMVNDPYSREKSSKLWDIGDITKTAKGAWAYYAKGTNNFGIYGENYRTEFAINKKTGEWFEANEPTLVNTDEYDVVGEKTSAKIKQIGKPLPMYATGTPISDPDIREMVKKVSSETGVPANILLSVIDQESDNTWSSGNPDKGGTSYGYMQLRTPGVLDDLPANRRQAAMTDKYSNILEGAKFLKRLFDNYSDWTKAASAYNQGEAGFKRHGINKYGKDVVARANSTAFVQAAQNLSSISTAVQAVSTDTSDIATNTDTIATKDMKTELQNIVDSTSTPTELAKYQDDLLNYIKDKNGIQEKNNDEFLAAWEKLQAEDETAKSVLADYDKQLADNRWSDNYNEIKDAATKYASSYAINTIKAQTGIQVNELLKQYDDKKAVLNDILKYFRKRKADGASADELKVIAQAYSEQLQNVESASDSYVSTIQSETDYLLNIAERNTKYVKDQITWQEKINEGLERQAKLTSNVNDKLSLQKDIIDGNDTKRELYQKQKDNAHRNVLDILNSDDKDYQEVLKQFQSVEPWFDATGEFSAQYEADLARLGASTPKLVPYMKKIASLIQVYKKAWYEADNEMQQTLDDTASRIDEVYATRTDKITKAISNSEWVLDMLGDGNFDLRLEETNTQLQNNLDKTVEIKNQQEYVNELYQRGSITYEQFVEKSQTLQEDLQSVYTTIKSILNSIKQIKIDTIQKNIDDINDQLEEIHDASDRITDSIDARMDVLNDEKDELDELQDKWDKVASAVKKVLSDQKELLDDEKESVSDYWDDRIKAIEKANEETDRNISLLEKQKELSKAKEQQTALIYQNGKFTYQADPKAVQDAEYALAEEQRSIKQNKAKEALEEQKNLAIKNIEDQIDAINKYQEKWNEVFDWYKNEVNEQAAYDQLGADWMNDTMALKTSILNQVGNAYKNNESIIEGSINKEIKALEKQEKALDRQVKAQERAANAKIRDYNNEIRAIERTSDKFDDLYRQIVEYFKTGNTDAIPGIIKSFVEEFNGIVDNIDVKKLTNAIFQALGMSPIGSVNSSSTSTSNSVNTSNNSKLSFDEANKKAIEILNDKGLDGLDEADKILLNNGYSLNKNSISTADGTGRKFIKVSDGNFDKYLAQSSDGRWILAADYSTAASIAGASSGNIGESSNNGSNNSSSSNIINNSTGTANNDMDHSETNQAEKNKQDAISWLKTYQKENGGAFNTIAYRSSKEAYDANVDTVKDSKKSILVVYYVSGEHYAVGKIQYGDTVPKTLKRFGKGTKNAPRGLSIINDGKQYSGELVNFRGGEQVIPADKSIKLIDGLTDLTESDLGRLLLENGSMQAQSFLEPFKQSLFDNNALQNLNNMKQVDNSITISNINMYETENVNDFIKQLNRQLPLAAKKIKR